MIKQMRASYFHNFKNAQYCALSNDPIPDYLENGDQVYIIDQGKIYYWDEASSSLYEYKGNGEGGSGGSSSFIPCFGSLATVQLGTTWSGDDPYTSTVTVTGYTVTSQTMVSVLPSDDVIEQMLTDGITNIFITNNDGVLTATAIGATPTIPMTLQVLCTESDISGDIAELPSIVGSGIIETVEADNLTDAVNILGNEVSELTRHLNDKPDINLGITGASVGQIIRVLTVDANGKPQTWEAVDEDRVVTVSGTTAAIVAEAGVRYVCGELAELTFTPPASGLTAIRFTSGTTPTVISLLPAADVKMPDDWTGTLEANQVYELNFEDRLGLVTQWS